MTKPAREAPRRRGIGRPVPLAVFATLVASTFLALAALATLLPHDAYVRYQSVRDTIHWRAQWIYERIHFDPEPVTVAFFGSSRTNSAVSARLLERELARRGVADPRVANLSLAASGFDLRHAIARELLGEKQVSLVVFTVVEQFPRDGHHAFGDLASRSDVLGAPWLVNRNHPRNLAYLPMRQLKLAWLTHFAEALGYARRFDGSRYLGTTYDKWFTTDLPGGRESPPDRTAPVEVLERESAFRRGDLTPAILPEPLQRFEFGVSRSYLRRIADLCERHGAALRILYLPFYKGWREPFEIAYLEGIAPLWNANHYLEDPTVFNDVAHMNRKGAEQLVPWLADRVAPVLLGSRTGQGEAP